MWKVYRDTRTTDEDFSKSETSIRRIAVTTSETRVDPERPDFSQELAENCMNFNFGSSEQSSSYHRQPADVGHWDATKPSVAR